MATIKLYDVRTGDPFDYPLAYFDYDLWREENPNDSVTEVAVVQTAAEGVSGIRWNALSAKQKKCFSFSVNTKVAKYLTDIVAPTTTRNLLYIPTGTKWSSLFTPDLSSSAITYSPGQTPPSSDYGTNNEWGYYYEDAGIPMASIHNTRGNYQFAYDNTHNVLYKNESATKKFRTQNGCFFGISTWTGVAYWPGSGGNKAMAWVGVGARQYGDTSKSPEGISLSYSAWTPQNEYGEAIASSFPNLYNSTWSAFDLEDNIYNEDSLCATEQISTQIIQTRIDGESYFAVAAILWKKNEQTSIYQADSVGFHFYPAWVFGGTEGEYTPDEPPITGDIPPREPSHDSGTWTIVNNPAGIATIPGGSPLSAIGKDDAGLHLYIVNTNALKAVSELLWSKLTEDAIASLYSGIISCGLLPYKFVSPYLTNNNKCTSINIGSVNMVVPSNSTWHLNQSLFHSSFMSGETVEFTTILRKTYGSYLDYEPYTTVSLTLPFIGEVPLPASCCIGGSVKVDYNCNLTTGDVCATIRTTSSDALLNGTTQTGSLDRTFYAYGNCFARFPLIGTSNGYSQYANIIPSIINAGTDFMGRNYMGAVSNLGEALKSGEKAVTQPIFGGSTIGSPSLIGNKKIVLTVSRPTPYYEKDFLAYNPIGNKGVGKLKNYHQSTESAYHVNGQWDKVVVSDIELGSTGMTVSEVDKVKTLLRGGVLV